MPPKVNNRARNAERRPKEREVVYLYPKQEINLAEEGWVRIELKHTLWTHANMSLVVKTSSTVNYVLRQIQEVYGRVESISLYLGEHTQDYNRVVDTVQTVGNLLQTYGNSEKAAAEAFGMFYDFQPYNANEPLLLAIS